MQFLLQFFMSHNHLASAFHELCTCSHADHQLAAVAAMS